MNTDEKSSLPPLEYQSVKPRPRRSRLASTALLVALSPMWGLVLIVVLHVLTGDVRPPVWVDSAEAVLGWVIWSGPVVGLVLGIVAQVRIERSKGAMRGGLQCAFAIAIGLMVIMVVGAAYLARGE